jgi:uncharacterized SAM-binding protein YcdF (DUF218 family)
MAKARRQARKPRRIGKGLVWALGVLGVWLTVLGVDIWRFGAVDHARRADCVIVLGAAIDGKVPSPVFAERIRHGVALIEAGKADTLIFTGGVGEGDAESESRVAAGFAEQLGMRGGRVLIEEKSRTTKQNLTEAARLMEQNHLGSAIIVSDPLHMKRAMAMAGDVGLSAVSSPTPTSRYRSLQANAGFLAREVYFLQHYWLFGE